MIFAVARLESLRAQDAFERFRLYDVLPRERVFHRVADAVAALATSQASVGLVTPNRHIARP